MQGRLPLGDWSEVTDANFGPVAIWEDARPKSFQRRIIKLSRRLSAAAGEGWEIDLKSWEVPYMGSGAAG